MTPTTPPIEIVSHRGARFEAPENTVAGFQHAIALGMSTVEFDVHLTADDEIVVIHDATVDRTTNGTGAVNKLTLAQLQALDARSVHPDWPEPTPIPTFREVMDTLVDMPTMEVEIKTDSPENLRKVVVKVFAALDEIDRHEGVVITSFDPVALQIAMDLRPEQPRGLIGRWDMEYMWKLAEHFDIERAGINLGIATPDIVARASERGYLPIAWPCNDADAVAKTLACGFHAVCTDNPSLIAPQFGRQIAR